MLGAVALMPVLAVGPVGGAPSAGAAASVVQDVLMAVRCPAPGDCIAVGYSGTPHSQRALIEVWDGKSWDAVTPPLPKNTFSSSLDGISCPATGSCMTVGDYLDVKTGFIEPLVERGSGSTWTVIANPGLDAGSGAILDSVSCTSKTACLAVGEDLEGNGLGRAERWNGTRWAVLSPLTPANATGVGLDDVSCSTADACTVVGFYGLGGDQLTLAESFDGTKWTVETTPGGAEAALRSVSCVSATDCMAVGESVTPAGSQVPFAASWNGKAWTATAAKAPAGRAAPELDAVTCASARSCIAVGFSSQDSPVNPTEGPLAETWNGSAWILIDPPPAPSGSQLLAGVAPTATAGAMAVGNDDDAVSGAQHTLAEDWNGSSWTTLATPSP